MLENKLDNILAKDDEENEGKWYYLDFFPVTFQAGNDRFDEFESFIQEKYYKSFSKKLPLLSAQSSWSGNALLRPTG